MADLLPEARQLLSQAITAPDEETLGQAKALLEKIDEALGPKQPRSSAQIERLL